MTGAQTPETFWNEVEMERLHGLPYLLPCPRPELGVATIRLFDGAQQLHAFVWKEGGAPHTACGVALRPEVARRWDEEGLTNVNCRSCNKKRWGLFD